jgi:hypothetical protein
VALLPGARVAVEPDQVVKINRDQGKGAIHDGTASLLQPLQLVAFRPRETARDILLDQVHAAAVRRLEGLTPDLGEVKRQVVPRLVIAQLPAGTRDLANDLGAPAECILETPAVVGSPTG